MHCVKHSGWSIMNGIHESEDLLQTRNINKTKLSGVNNLANRETISCKVAILQLDTYGARLNINEN